MSTKPFPEAPDYPFEPRWHETPQGRMHYVDEGQGAPVVFVHGMPTWSFLWRRFVAGLSDGHRRIAVDHLGFGRSDKPPTANYHPRALSEHLSDLIEALDLRDITLVVHDFGGPIGLGHAIRHPGTIRRLVIFNTWMWSLHDHAGARKVDRAVVGALGHVVYRWFNGSARWLVPRVLGEGKQLDSAVHRAYVEATQSSEDRVGQLALARNLVGASDWYDELWRGREVLAGKPAQLIWGMQDPTFQPEDLLRWQELFPDAHVTKLERVGHFPQEEDPETALAAMRRFLA